MMERSTPSDSWGQINSITRRPGPDAAAHTSSTWKASKPQQAIREDWDSDDEESDDHAVAPETWMAEKDSSEVWQEASVKKPMPELIIAPSGTRQGTMALPATVLGPAVHILQRRPQSSAKADIRSMPGSNGVVIPSSQTLADRQARYMEARSRIFGPSNGPEQKTAGDVSWQSDVATMHNSLESASQSCSDEVGNGRKGGLKGFPGPPSNT